jgi:hypothetical protein
MQLTLALDTKRCARCRQQLPLENFTPDKKAKDGRHSFCRSCRHAPPLSGPEQLTAALIEYGLGRGAPDFGRGSGRRAPNWSAGTPNRRDAT